VGLSFSDSDDAKASDEAEITAADEEQP